MCRTRRCQALPGLIKWSATLCIVTAWWVLAAAAMSCRALMPKRGLSWWMGSLSPSNYRWIFRRCSLPALTGVVCVCVGESGGYCYTGWTAGGQLVCVRGSRGSCFSPAVSSLQYSWALWGSVCCAALRPPLHLKLPSLLHQTLTQVWVCTWLSAYRQLWPLYIYKVISVLS